MNESLLNQDLRELHSVLADLKKIEQKQTSLRWNFWRGVFYGFGAFIGSVVLTAAVVYFLTHISIDGSTVVGRFINNLIQSAADKTK